jgi:hypothetical protein
MICSFLLGLIEFRSCVTSHTNYELAYDWGREIAHRLTLRQFEQ